MSKNEGREFNLQIKAGASQIRVLMLGIKLGIQLGRIVAYKDLKKGKEWAKSNIIYNKK